MREVYRNGQTTWVEKNQITQGSRVKVLNKVPSHHMGWNNSWVNEMDNAVGKVLEVLSTEEGHAGILLKNTSGSHDYKFPYFVLELMTNPDTITTGTPVLVRDNQEQKWHYSLYSHKNVDKCYSYCTASGDYKYCIPYKGNERLVGKTNACS